MLSDYAKERDASINALYARLDTCSLKPGKEARAKITLYDFTEQGLEDILNCRVRAISMSLEENFKRHPEQMIRLVRIASDLGFTIELKTLKAIRSCSDYFAVVRPARRLQEFSKLFLRGYARENYEWLEALGLLSYFTANQSENTRACLKSLMSLIDQRVRKEELFTDWRADLSNQNWLLACFLWEDGLREEIFEKSLEQASVSRIFLSPETMIGIKTIWLKWACQPALCPFSQNIEVITDQKTLVLAR